MEASQGWQKKPSVGDTPFQVIFLRQSLKKVSDENGIVSEARERAEQENDEIETWKMERKRERGREADRTVSIV